MILVNWILFARNSSGKPVISAMKGGDVVRQINTEDKTDLITFLKDFPGAGTFLVAKPETSSEPLGIANLLPEDDPLTPGLGSSAAATWFHLFRDDADQPVVVAMNGTSGVETYRGNIKGALISFLSKHTGANTFQVAPPDEVIPDAPVALLPALTPTPTPKGRVLLEIGHGPGPRFDPGAIAPDGTTEHALNIIAANAARDVLDQAGVFCTVIDTPQGSLHTIGLQAAGFDVFCSVHHNAANRSAQGAEVLIHKTKADTPDRELAKMIAKEVATELGITLRRGDGINATRSLGVLSGAEDTNVQAAVLAEVYFMDVSSLSIADKQDWSTRGGKAIGRAILEWLARNPRP